MRKLFALAAVLIVALAMLLAANPVSATTGGVPLSATLLGTNELGGGEIRGSGTATLSLNPGHEQICYTLQVSGVSTPLAAHIHAGPAGINGPIVVPLLPPTNGTSSGCADVSRDLILAIIRNPENYYVNVHTALFPAGA